MSLSRQPGGGQLPLPGQETHPALVHVLTPEFLGLDQAEFTDVTSEMTELATAGYFCQSLIDVDRHGPASAFYQPAGKREGLWLALTPEEFKMIPHSIAMIGKTAYSGTLAARSERASFGADKSSAERSRLHAAKAKLQRLEPYLENAIEHRLELTGKFKEMAKYPNLARGDQIGVRMRFNGLRSFVIGDMFRAIRVQKGWDAPQAELAAKSVVKRLALDGTAGQRALALNEVLDLAEEYYGHKRALFKTKIWETKKYIRDNTTDE